MKRTGRGMLQPRDGDDDGQMGRRRARSSGQTVSGGTQSRAWRGSTRRLSSLGGRVRPRGRRQEGSGRARNRARAPLNWVSQGQRFGRCKVRRRAERVSRPAIEKKRRRRVLVVTSCSPRPIRAVQRASNCVGCQEGWAISAGHEPRHVELFLTMAFRMVSSLRMQATKATFFALPAASSLW